MWSDVRFAPLSALGGSLSLTTLQTKLACSDELASQECLSCVQEVAASYSFGAVGSLIYLRLLNRSVDSVGGFSVGAALGQPRLLIPIILTAAYNR